MSVSDDEVDEFVDSQKIKGKVDQNRVKDFYNAMSNVISDGDIRENERIDYEQDFNAHNAEEFAKVDQMKEAEKDFIRKLNKTELVNDRLLKVATIMAKQFEEEQRGGAEMSPEELSNHVRLMMSYDTEYEGSDKPATFGEMLDVDVTFMKYLALLSDKKAFSKTGTKLVEDPLGRIIKYAEMEQHTDITKMDLLNVAMPNFNRKMATKDIYVKKRFTKVEKAQNLIILVDNSGSMSDERKKGMLKAALCLKIKDVNENHNVYVGTFLEDVIGFTKITRETTFEGLRSFIHLSGGNTEVGTVVQNTLDMVRKRKLKGINNGPALTLSEDHFEIMVINDGADHVEDFHPQVKLHALCLLQTSTMLKNICHRSGGTYMHLK